MLDKDTMYMSWSLTGSLLLLNILCCYNKMIKMSGVVSCQKVQYTKVKTKCCLI